MTRTYGSWGALGRDSYMWRRQEERAGRGPFSLTAIATAAQRKKPPQVIIVVHGIDFMCSQCSLRLLEALRE